MSFRIIRVILSLLLFFLSACDFVEQNPEFDYSAKLGETFSDNAPVVEFDKNGLAHILVHKQLLYTKPGETHATDRVWPRNTHSVYYKVGEEQSESNSFKNLDKFDQLHFLFGKSDESGDIYTIVKDLDKYVLFKNNSSGWSKMQSVSLRIGWPYEFKEPLVTLNKGHIVLPYYFNQGYTDEFNEEEENSLGLAGIQVDNKRLSNKSKISSEHQKGWYTSFQPFSLHGMSYVPCVYSFREQKTHFVYLYRTDSDTLTQEVLPEFTDTEYISPMLAKVDGSVRLYVGTADSLYIFDVALGKSERISVQPNEDNEVPSVENVDFAIDNNGCFHVLSRPAVEGEQDFESERSKTYETVFEQGRVVEKIPKYLYSKMCDEPELDTLTLPDSLDSFYMSTSIDMNVSDSGEPVFALVLHHIQNSERVIDGSVAHWKNRMNDKLYIVRRTRGEWVFTPIDK